MEVMGFFYRHNIHPYTECMKREDTLRDYAQAQDLKMIWQKGYEMEEFMRSVAFGKRTGAATAITPG